MRHREVRFKSTAGTLRDELALDRTLLSNERTLLAYLRSSIGLTLAGFTFIELFKGSWLQAVGAVAIPVAGVVGVVGMIRYRRMSRAIARVRARLFERVQKLERIQKLEQPEKPAQ